MDEEMIFLLQRLEEAFKDMTGYSLRESDKAAEYIRKNRKTEDSHPVSSRVLRDYWPSGKKSKKDNARPAVNSMPSNTTLNPIAECAGYRSWEAFKRIMLRQEITMHTYFDPKDFNVEKMTEDDPPIIIGWYPHYFIELQYLGNYKFEILSFSYNLRHNYKVKDILDIYGFEVRYAYEVSDIIGIKSQENDIKTDKENKKEYVSGCPFHPELRLLRSPIKYGSPEEEESLEEASPEKETCSDEKKCPVRENISAFVVHSYQNYNSEHNE